MRQWRSRTRQGIDKVDDNVDGISRKSSGLKNRGLKTKQVDHEAGACVNDDNNNKNNNYGKVTEQNNNKRSNQCKNFEDIDVNGNISDEITEAVIHKPVSDNRKKQNNIDVKTNNIRNDSYHSMRQISKETFFTQPSLPSVVESPTARSRMRRAKESHRDCLMLTLLTMSLVCGIGLGVLLNYFEFYKYQNRFKYLRIPGDLCLRLLKMILIPLVVCSNISSMATMTLRATGWMSLIASLGFLTSLSVAAIIGLGLAHMVSAGRCPSFISQVNHSIVHGRDSAADSQNVDEVFMNLITNAVPDNVIQAAVEMTIVKYETVERHIDDSLNISHAQLIPRSSQLKNVNVLGIIFFSVTFGLSLHSIGEKRALLVELCQSVRQAMVQLLKTMMWFQPVGIMFLTMWHIASGVPLAQYAACYTGYISFMLTGVFFVFFLQFMAVWILARKNPFVFTWNCLPALMCAAGSSSTAATLPYTLYCLEKQRAIVDPRATRFLIPCASVMNKNGTALWLAFTSVLIANAANLPVTVGTVSVQIVAAMFYSMGASTTPSGGMSMARMLAGALGLPGDVVTVLDQAEWVVDRFRTVNNVYGGMVMTAVSSEFCRKELVRDSRRGAASLYNSGDKDTYKMVRCTNPRLREINVRRPSADDVETSPLARKVEDHSIHSKRTGFRLPGSPAIYLTSSSPTDVKPMGGKVASVNDDHIDTAKLMAVGSDSSGNKSNPMTLSFEELNEKGSSKNSITSYRSETIV